MPHSISDRSARALIDLFPTAQGRPDGPTWLVDQLVEAEQHRRGAPDSVSGAFHALALNQGSLLKEEFDLGTHRHHDGWVIGALLVDPLEFMLYDMRHGFEAGDRALRAMVDAMRSVCPKGKVVRTHTDGFAILLGPTSETTVSTALLEPLRAALTEKVTAVTPGGAQAPVVTYTLGALELTVVDPPNWQLLGPLVWAECERAHLIVRRSKVDGVLRRRVVLDGRLPAFND